MWDVTEKADENTSPDHDRVFVTPIATLMTCIAILTFSVIIALARNLLNPTRPHNFYRNHEVKRPKVAHLHQQINHPSSTKQHF